MNRTIVIAGQSNTGKSTSLRNLKNREKYAYLNADDKALPIRGANAFLKNMRITEPTEVLGFYPQFEGYDGCEGVILDTLTYLMGSYERKVVNTSSNTMEGWKNYGIYYKELNDLIKNSNKTHIIMAHTETLLNEQSMQMESKILVKGAVGKIGVEADHTVVVTTKQMPVAKLKEYDTPLLTYTEAEEASGMKYVFSVQLNKETVGDRTRAPYGFWEAHEQYIDNDIQLVLDRWDEYYG
jgi:hypothetical protein